MVNVTAAELLPEQVETETPTQGRSQLDRPRQARPANRSPWLVLAVVALAQLTAVLDVTIVNIALPSAQLDLALSNQERGAVVTVYALAFGSLLLLGGRISDFWGRKRSFVVGIGCFGLASGLGGLAGSAELFLVARGLQGAFAALLAPAALALVSTTFPAGRNRARAFAIYGVIGGGGAALGLVLGGVLTEYLNWRWCLLVNVPIAALALLLAVPILTESRVSGRARYDVPGAGLVTAGLALLVLGLSNAHDGWVRSTTLAPIAAGTVLLGAFVLVERRTADPLLPLRVIGDRVRAGVYLTSAVVGAVLLGAVLFLTFHFQFVMGMTPLQAGLASLPLTIALMATAPGGTTLLGVLGARALLTVGPLIAAAGLVWLSFITVDGNYWTQILPGQVILGIGLALAFVPLQNVALSGIDARDAGVASAALTATQQIGGSAGTALFTALYAAAAASTATTQSDRGVPAADPAAMVHGYAAVFVAAAVTLVALSPLTWTLVKVDRRLFRDLDVTRDADADMADTQADPRN